MRLGVGFFLNLGFNQDEYGAPPPYAKCFPPQMNEA